MQLTHYQTTFEKKTFPVCIICDQVTSPANVGAIFRAADAFGVAKIYFCGTVLPDFGKRMQKTSRSTEKYVPFEIAEDITQVIASLKTEAYKVLALEITDDSIPLQQMPLTGQDKVAIIIGAENTGVSSEVLAMATTVTHIPMYGTNSSMNVAQALVLALYETTNKLT